jgi:hypothetical protein
VLRLFLIALAALALGAGAASASRQSAGPIGPLPKPTVTTVRTPRSTLVAVALPRRAGLDWRIAGKLDSTVVREVSEADAGASVVLVFKAVGKGKAKIVVAETRGEQPHAYRAVEYDVTVT